MQQQLLPVIGVPVLWLWPCTPLDGAQEQLGYVCPPQHFRRWKRAALGPSSPQIPAQGGAQSPHQCLTPHPEHLMALFGAATLQNAPSCQHVELGLTAP